MDKPNGGLKDIFSTILGETTRRPPNTPPPKIVVHGNGNVIALGGTVHYVQARESHAGRRTPGPQR